MQWNQEEEMETVKQMEKQWREEKERVRNEPAPAPVVWKVYCLFINGHFEDY